MHRQLPKDLNLYALSFLSSKEVIQTGLINKTSKQMTKEPFFWKSRIKDEFCLTNTKEIKNPSETYKQLYQQLKIEDALYLDLMVAYFFSLQIQIDTINGKNQDPWDKILNTFRSREQKISSSRLAHFKRLEEFDLALLSSKDIFREKLEILQKKFPEINLLEIRKNAHAYLLGENESWIKTYWDALSEDDKNHFSITIYLVAAKTNAAMAMRVFLTYNIDNLPKNFLEDLLQIAAIFLNIEIAKVLIEFGAKVNCLVDAYDYYGNYAETTPLFEVLNSIRKQRIADPTKCIEIAKEFIHLLLENGADPLARIYLADEPRDNLEPGTEAYENAKQSIRDLCLIEKENPECNTVELLDLIIEAAKKNETRTLKL